MSGVSIGHPHPRPFSGEKTLRRCRNNEGSDNIILIDVDTENFDNVVIIDVPESLPKKTKPSSMLRKDKTLSIRNVIYIDDDENLDSNDYFSAGKYSNTESFCVANNFSGAAFEESQYAQDTSPPVRLSKCKRTYSGQASMRNRYGLSADSESDSSDSDCPDCELVEDSSGKVQELWEKASSRRKKDFQNGHSDNKDHDSTSFGYSTGNRNSEKDDPSCFRAKEDADFGHAHAFDVSVDHPECETGSSNHHIEENCQRPGSYNFAFSRESDKEFDHPTPVSEDEEPPRAEPSPPKFQSYVDEYISMLNMRQEEDKDGQLHSRNGENLPSAEVCIISEREKLKETDEYKRAMEEEWASRQQALQIQAEEAKLLRRLQKRRNAENMRLLDMERRQKQRIEEVRNIQKKDEENMNLKERSRAEVRNELKKLEVSCHTMASLLHSLGIRVDGWPNPLPQEVQTAYKRALLTFHPDRASRSDIRQQVEAEEKFKLINRLKEKFSPSF